MAGSLLVDKRKLLERIGIFSQLAPRELEQLAEIAATKRLKPKQLLMRKGDDGSQVYVIISGRLKVFTAGEDGKESVLRIMDPGEVIGEIALFDGQTRSASVSALERADLLVMQRRDLIPFLERNPKTAIKLLGALADLVRRISEQFEDRVFLNLPNRLAKKLLALSDTYGKDSPGGTRIDLKLSQGALGEMVGTSRESVNKQLRSWVEGGVVRNEKGFLTLIDLDELERLAGFTIS